MAFYSETHWHNNRHLPVHLYARCVSWWYDIIKDMHHLLEDGAAWQLCGCTVLLYSCTYAWSALACAISYIMYVIECCSTHCCPAFTHSCCLLLSRLAPTTMPTISRTPRAPTITPPKSAPTSVAGKSALIVLSLSASFCGRMMITVHTGPRNCYYIHGYHIHHEQSSRRSIAVLISSQFWNASPLRLTHGNVQYNKMHSVGRCHSHNDTHTAPVHAAALTCSTSAPVQASCSGNVYTKPIALHRLQLFDGYICIGCVQSLRHPSVWCKGTICHKVHRKPSCLMKGQWAPTDNGSCDVASFHLQIVHLHSGSWKIMEGRQIRKASMWVLSSHCYMTLILQQLHGQGPWPLETDLNTGWILYKNNFTDTSDI